MKKLFVLGLVFLFLGSPIIKSQNLWDQIKGKAKEYYDKGKEKVRDVYENTRENVKEKTREYLDNSRETIRDLNNRYHGSYEKVFDKTKEITSEIRKNPKKVFEYKRKADKIVQGAIITSVKSIPVYDPNTGELTNFDSYCRNFVSEVGGNAFSGSELQEDPVGLAVMVMMDNDYLLDAKLIRSPDGDWISANDALNSSLDQNSVGLLHTDYGEMKSAYLIGDHENFIRNLNEFRDDIASISWYCGYSCPWIYLFDGEKYFKFDEIIKDQNSESLDSYQSLILPIQSIINSEVSILISEELDEVSFLDHIYLEINDIMIDIENQSNTKKYLSEADEHYYILEKGHVLLIKFKIPISLEQIKEVKLVTKGYYIPVQKLSYN